MERRHFFKHMAGQTLASLSPTQLFSGTAGALRFTFTQQKDAPNATPLLSNFSKKSLCLPRLHTAHFSSETEKIWPKEIAKNWQNWAQKHTPHAPHIWLVDSDNPPPEFPENMQKLVWLGETPPSPLPTCPVLLVVMASDHKNTEDLMPFLSQLPTGSDVFAMLPAAEDDGWPEPLLNRLAAFCQED